MKSKRIYLSFVCISLVLLVLALFILSKANYEHTKEKIIMIPNSSVSAKNNEIVPAPNKNIAYEEEKTI